MRMSAVRRAAPRATATHPTNSRIGDRWPLHVTGTGLIDTRPLGYSADNGFLEPGN